MLICSHVWYSLNLYNRREDARVFWRCTERRNECKAMAITCANTDVIIYQPEGVHNHEKPAVKVAIVDLKKKVKEDVHQPIKRLYSQAFEAEDPEDVSGPSYTSLKLILYRERKTLIPPLPVRLRGIALQGCWTETLDSESFLLANDGDDDKMLVFSTDKNLEILSASRDFYMDGIFSVSPHLFSQLYTLHVMFLGQMIPVVFALLANKAQSTYTRLFDILSHLCHTRNLPLDPRAIHTDFEMAALQACRISFPKTSLRGCFFHYTQSIWRKVQNLHLAIEYNENRELKTFVRRLAVLPLVPIEDVDEAWMLVHGEAPEIPGVTELCDYMVKTWVDDQRPLFHREVWSHFASLEEESVRTNNNLESFHSAFAKSFRSPHPNIFSLVTALKKKQETVIAVHRFNFGHPPPPKKRAFKLKEDRIMRIKTQLQNGQRGLLNYMDAMGTTVKMQ
ncbi:hypothetical protein ACOMHN_060955 [Nucella lapillus]